MNNKTKKIFKFLFVVFIMLYFPFNLYLKCDLDLNGKIVMGQVIKIDYRDYKGNRGSYQIVKTEYKVNNKSYSRWFSSHANKKLGDTLAVKYSPLLPIVSARYHEHMDSWKDSIWVTIFLECFCLLACFVVWLQQKLNK